mmetsp:Transcript_26603/g.55572  ORF Transcript_26603/g.55572 Transcript_26603/m.55572 type:complete len:351 (+) Transcript_26603:1984-3036(+)
MDDNARDSPFAVTSEVSGVEKKSFDPSDFSLFSSSFFGAVGVTKKRFLETSPPVDDDIFDLVLAALAGVRRSEIPRRAVFSVLRAGVTAKKEGLVRYVFLTLASSQTASVNTAVCIERTLLRGRPGCFADISFSDEVGKQESAKRGEDLFEVVEGVIIDAFLSKRVASSSFLSLRSCVFMWLRIQALTVLVRRNSNCFAHVGHFQIVVELRGVSSPPVATVAAPFVSGFFLIVAGVFMAKLVAARRMEGLVGASSCVVLDCCFRGMIGFGSGTAETVLRNLAKATARGFIAGAASAFATAREAVGALATTIETARGLAALSAGIFVALALPVRDNDHVLFSDFLGMRLRM